MVEFLNDGQVLLDSKDVKIQDLEDEISLTKAEVICMKPQLYAIQRVHNQAFGYGNGATLQRFESFLVANSQTDIRSLNLEDLKPDLIS